jgi:hypothetical protein
MTARTHVQHETSEQETADAVFPQLLPLPFMMPASGLYTYSSASLVPHIPISLPQNIPVPSRPTPPGPVELAEPEIDARAFDSSVAAVGPLTGVRITREELRLDVDGRYPQMTASGAILVGLTTRLHWIARVKLTSPNHYSGVIWYKTGNTQLLPQTNVTIVVVRSIFNNQRTATVTFSGGGATRTITFRYSSAYFRPCELEYDCAQGTAGVTTFDTSTHSNRPLALANETLSIATVYQRAGIEAAVSSSPSAVPINGAGIGSAWSDAEMHDAMITYWSRFANAPQWAAWVFFASISEMGQSLGGIMFDSIGPNHRQGTAIFEDSFIAQPPAGDPQANAAVQRLMFWTAVHEIGHTFNLAHSWQKSLGTPWIPLATEPEARSFMNYPYNVSGGAHAFFSNFEYRFSDSELLFMRHAPAGLVEQGFADWFDDHGFEQAAQLSEPGLRLQVRANRENGEFQFLEPVVLELKLTNVSSEPRIIDANVLKKTDDMTIVVKRQGSRARTFRPFARYCYRADRRVLMPGESIYESLFVSVGSNGWLVAEPGRLVVQVALHDDSSDVLSNPMALRIAPSRGYDEEYLAQDVFTEDVGRVLTFDGSEALGDAVDTLRLAAERLSDRRIATHARIALGAPAMRQFKRLRFEGETGKIIDARSPDPESAIENFDAALIADPELAAETLGHVDTKFYAEMYANWLAETGRPSDGAKVLATVANEFDRRGVLPSVVTALRTRQMELEGESGVKLPEGAAKEAAPRMHKR